MTKYDKFLNEWTYPYNKDLFKKELDEVIEERIIEFAIYFNKTPNQLIGRSHIERFLQNKED